MYGNLILLVLITNVWLDHKFENVIQLYTSHKILSRNKCNLFCQKLILPTILLRGNKLLYQSTLIYYTIFLKELATDRFHSELFFINLNKI